MINLNATFEADTGNEKVVKSYSYSFDTEQITKEELQQFFRRALEEFVEDNEKA